MHTPCILLLLITVSFFLLLLLLLLNLVLDTWGDDDNEMKGFRRGSVISIISCDVSAADVNIDRPGSQSGNQWMLSVAAEQLSSCGGCGFLQVTLLLYYYCCWFRCCNLYCDINESRWRAYIRRIHGNWENQQQQTHPYIAYRDFAEGWWCGYVRMEGDKRASITQFNEIFRANDLLQQQHSLLTFCGFHCCPSKSSRHVQQQSQQHVK